MKTYPEMTSLLVFGLLALAACAPTPAKPDRVIGPAGVEPMTSGTPSVGDTSGSTTSTAVPEISGPFIQVDEPSQAVPPAQSPSDGPLTLTRENSNQSVNLTVGQTFQAQLGGGYTWEITVSDEKLLKRTPSNDEASGDLGQYEALQPGTVTLMATGSPLCRQSKPACGLPDILFRVTLVIK